MKNYRCVIWSTSSRPREYIVHTSSAYKAAQELGRCEDGEVVEVSYISMDKIISCAVWSCGQYIRVEVKSNDFN